MEEWILSEKNFGLKHALKYESIMCQGNGYMGIRNSYEEPYTVGNRGVLINGTFDAASGEVSELPFFPDALNFRITINNEEFSLLKGKIEKYSREFNLKNGESIRNITWISPKGKTLKICFKKFVSNVRKHIVAQRIEITALSDIKLTVVTGIDGKVTNTGVQHFGAVQRRMYKNKEVGLYVKTIQSEVLGTVHSSLKSSREGAYMVFTDRRSVYQKEWLDLKENECVVFEKISSYMTSRDFEHKDKPVKIDTLRLEGLAAARTAAAMGYDKLLKENNDNWNEFWNKKKITIESHNVFFQKALNFAQYHLRIMANGDDNRVGIGAKGLSGEAYKGHSFWDTEIFILPYYIFTAPSVARKLLEYRYQLLTSACAKAKKYGFYGAMYPWEGAWIDDGETCPEEGDMDMVTGEIRKNLMGEIEVHISADVAYGVWQYFCATGDVDFMEKFGYEIIILTALFWVSRAEYKNGRLEITNVIGPDEYKDGVDNNAYTNYMAFFNVVLAKKYLPDITKALEEKLDAEFGMEFTENKFNEFIAKIYLPKPNKDGIIPQFDGYENLEEINLDKYKNKDKVGLIFKDYSFEEMQKIQVAKQADTIMLFYLLEDMFSKETILKNFAYYEKRTCHDSSLSMCIHSLVEARNGDLKMADSMFENSCSVDLGDKTNNSDAGIHAASIGGIWLAFVMGYAGMRIKENEISFSPVLPEGWKKYHFNICFRGDIISVEVNRGACIVKGNSKTNVRVNYNGKVSLGE